jgi:hypothetical protein
MRALKIGMLLLVISFGCAFILAAAGVSGHGLASGRAIGETIGAGIFIFVIALLAIGVTAIFSRRAETMFTVGALAAVGVTCLNWLGSV